MNYKKSLIALAAACSMFFAACSSSDSTDKKQDSEVTENKKEDQNTSNQEEQKSEKPTASTTEGPKYEVTMKIKDHEPIVFEMTTGTAPETVENFVQLAQSGFYDGLTFHRIIDGFMIQGGDPTGTGMGGSSHQIEGEFAANGFDNSLKHVRGTVSMARSSDPDSASSQFFIMHEDNASLDGQYAAFGTVISGMETVDELAKTPVTDGNGSVDPEDQPVIESVTVKEIEE